jgi:drug/metabolite transporter (DMT)-like permease
MSFGSMQRTARAPTPADPGAGQPSRPRVLLAFASVYLIWGSTYLAIRFAIQTMPPLTMASIRFATAGAALYAWARTRGGAPAPTRVQWRAAAIAGTLLLAGGNGAVVVAEQWVPSGLVALLVGAVPLWLVVLDAAFGSRTRPSRRAMLGLLVGFGGVVLLTGSPGVGAGGVEELVGAVLVLAGALSWAAGSLYSRYAQAPPRPRLWVAMQMLCGSVVLGVMALAFGELASFDLGAVSARSWWSLLYLILFGALVGYTAYIWLLTVSTPTLVGTYAYVNPVVALLLGWLFADEPLTFRSMAAAAIILGSVVVITSEPARVVGMRGAHAALAARGRQSDGASVHEGLDTR